MDYQLLASDKEWPNVIAIDDEDLIISFHRTIRLPPGVQTVPTSLPELGIFPLYEVDQFKGKLPDDILAKGGFFLPIYEKEAVWIQLLSRKQFAVKIYSGDINVMPGEHAGETTPSARDYVVTPQQRWIDGITSAENGTQQFATDLMDLGYTVDVPVNGSQTLPNLRLEIMKKKDTLRDEIYVEFPKNIKTPTLIDLEMDRDNLQNLMVQRFNLSEYDCIIKFQGKRCQERTVAECGIGRGDTVQIVPPGSTVNPDQPTFNITVTRLGGKVIPLENVYSEMEFIEVKEILSKTEDIPADDIRLIHRGRCLMDHIKLREFDIKQDSNLHMVVRLRPRAKTLPPSTTAELANAARKGLTKQPIVVPETSPESWDIPSRTIINVHLLNAALFHAVTDIQPPECPVQKATYTNLGLPYAGFSVDKGFSHHP